MALLMALPGCRGCRRSEDADKTDAQRAQAKKEKPKLPFEIRHAYMRPSDVERGGGVYKPGHWSSF
ncbi:MAG: hypothetical protein ABR915_25300, partial [Thermoguttaceae bacterium]